MKTEKSKHTPGPWYIYKDYYDNKTGKNSQIMYKCGDAQFTSLCRVIQNPGDAHLIAAAPELLAALEYCAEMLDDDGGRAQGVFYSGALAPDSDDITALDYIRAVIAKARGEK